MLLKPYFVFFILIFVRTSFAAPWVEPTDLSLRNDIQLLADSGIITAPVTTYPLMWNAIKDDITSVDITTLSKEQTLALNHVRFNFNYASSNQSITKKSTYLASHANRFTSYGNSNFDKSHVKISNEFFVGYLAGKFQINYRGGLENNLSLNQGSQLNIDGSYLAYKLGNWVFSASTIEQWWGPSIDTNLIMTTNSRPLPAISITRDNSHAFKTPWLSWIGPWTFKAQMAQLENTRQVPNALLWSARGTFRPLSRLEVGVSWSLQWGGKGQPSSISDFFKAITGDQECANGKLTCEQDMFTHYGNHLAGYDIRWSDTILTVPYALYWQAIGEDSPDGGLITDKADLYGIETRFTLFKLRIMANLEYTNTQVACDGDEPGLNCYYEHTIYKSGYRHYRRTIGSTYDNDAQSLAATFLIQTAANNSWQLKFRKVALNTDNIDLYNENINLGNSVSKVAEDVLQFDGQYKFIALNSRFTLGVTVTDSTFSNNIALANSSTTYKNSSNYNAYIQWEYRLK